MDKASREYRQPPCGRKRPLGEMNTTAETLESVEESRFKPEEMQVSSTSMEDGDVWKRRRMWGNSDKSNTFKELRHAKRGQKSSGAATDAANERIEDEGWTGGETPSSDSQLLELLEVRAQKREDGIREQTFAMLKVYNTRVDTLEERVAKLEKTVALQEVKIERLEKDLVSIKTLLRRREDEMKGMKERIDELIVFILRTPAEQSASGPSHA